MEIPITPEITAWIEFNRAVMLNQPKEYQWVDPGFKQVIDAYDAEMERKAIEQGYRDIRWEYVLHCSRHKG